MQALWGGEESAPAWEGIDEFREFAQIVMAVYDAATQGLRRNACRPYGGLPTTRVLPN
jgi:hypothetical protein